MDKFVMVRSFDHANYYKTRFLLMIAILNIVLYLAIKKKDTNYLVIHFYFFLYRFLSFFSRVNGSPPYFNFFPR